MGSEDAGARDFPVCCHAQPWFAPVSTSALAMRGMSGPGTRDGFDRHDILPTRPRGQTPRGDAPSSTRVQSEPTHRARNHEARYIPPSLIS